MIGAKFIAMVVVFPGHLADEMEVLLVALTPATIEKMKANNESGSERQSRVHRARQQPRNLRAFRSDSHQDQDKAGLPPVPTSENRGVAHGGRIVRIVGHYRLVASEL